MVVLKIHVSDSVQRMVVLKIHVSDSVQRMVVLKIHVSDSVQRMVNITEETVSVQWTMVLKLVSAVTFSYVNNVSYHSA